MKTVSIKCPYCGYVNSINVDANSFFSDGILNCDPEQGGCDRQFAYNVHFEPVILTSEINFHLVKKA